MYYAIEPPSDTIHTSILVESNSPEDALNSLSWSEHTKRGATVWPIMVDEDGDSVSYDGKQLLEKLE